MKKIIVTVMALALVLCNIGLVSTASAQTQIITSVDAAKDLAANAGGTYVEGASAPALTGNQVALPVIEESTGNVIGHVVADQASLVSALNAAGYTEVGAAVAGTEAGTVAGGSVLAGVSTGTIVTAAAVTAVTVGLVVAAASNNDSESSTTVHH